MYYPKSQIIVNLYTNGQEFMIEGTNQLYAGPYWKTSKNEFFTGKTPQDTPNKKLIKATSDFSQIPANLSVPTSDIALSYDAPYIGDDPNLYNESLILNYLRLNNISIISPPSTQMPVFSPNIPTQQDYQIGEYRRYFCKKTNEITYLEINKDTYDKLKNKDSQILYQLYFPFNMPWKLTGNKTQVYKTNRNIAELKSSLLKLPMFSEYLKNDFTKYYK